MNHTFIVTLDVNSSGMAELGNAIDGAKEVIIPVMALAFIEGIQAQDEPTIKAFEILQSVCLSVLAAFPGLKTTEVHKTFHRRDLN